LVFLAAEQGFQPAVKVRDSLTKSQPEDLVAELRQAAREELRRIAATDSYLGNAAEWCRKNQPDSYDCLRFAIADWEVCVPAMSGDYLETRYVRSGAYDACRRKEFGFHEQDTPGLT
jgi:hypothetical protein